MKKIFAALALFLLFLLAGCGSARAPVRSECDLPIGLHCTGFSYDKRSGFSLEVKNTGKFDMKDVVLKIEGCRDSAELESLSAGEEKTFSVQCSPLKDSVFESQISVTLKDDSGTDYLKIGKLTADMKYRDFEKE